LSARGRGQWIGHFDSPAFAIFIVSRRLVIGSLAFLALLDCVKFCKVALCASERRAEYNNGDSSLALPCVKVDRRGVGCLGIRQSPFHQGVGPKDQSGLNGRHETAMTKLRVCSFSLSVDGYGAGPHQDTANPLGLGGTALHEWAFGTRTFQKMFGGEGGTTGVDDRFAMRGFENIGAWIMGRNMFGPVRGPWPDETWKGWWGSNPPYHTPVFVLTHYERDPVVMEGGTTFHFVDDEIEAALRHAEDAANGRDVRLGGGIATIRQYLQAGLIHEMHIAIAPVLLGQGEHLFAGIDAKKLGYRCTEQVATPKATHIVISRSE
jgi:dihydrofolate reductase